MSTRKIFLISFVGLLVAAAILFGLTNGPWAILDRFFPPEEYSLLVETEMGDMEGEYHDNSTVALAEGVIGGNLVVYVNDSPVQLFGRNCPAGRKARKNCAGS